MSRHKARFAAFSNGEGRVPAMRAHFYYKVVPQGWQRANCRRVNRGSAALISMRLLSSYQNNNLGWHEVPQAVEHPRDTEKPPGTPSGRRLRLEIAKSPVERLFPPSGGVSRGSVRVGGETFLLPSYGFSFVTKRKGVSIAQPTEAQRNIAGQKICAP